MWKGILPVNAEFIWRSKLVLRKLCRVAPTQKYCEKIHPKAHQYERYMPSRQATASQALNGWKSALDTS